jgi:hypothetical protein
MMKVASLVFLVIGVYVAVAHHEWLAGAVLVAVGVGLWLSSK